MSSSGVPIGGKQQQIKVNLDDCTDVLCPACKKLGKEYTKFKPVVRFKVVPATLSPEGRELIVPVINYACMKCGNLLIDDNGRIVGKIER